VATETRYAYTSWPNWLRSITLCSGHHRDNSWSQAGQRSVNEILVSLSWRRDKGRQVVGCPDDDVIRPVVDAIESLMMIAMNDIAAPLWLSPLWPRVSTRVTKGPPAGQADDHDVPINGTSRCRNRHPGGVYLTPVPDFPGSFRDFCESPGLPEWKQISGFSLEFQ